MPIYEYACPTCKTKFEKLRAMEHGATADCPRCGQHASRVLSVMAPARVGGSTSPASTSMPSGGCCGGACGCH
ncbi:MAG: zinc ribbon domain-containing protein [SAR202 cluster bacterium]|nr:zinc ribbon domain-containing protein [SAR202 cluster bacterium]